MTRISARTMVFFDKNVVEQIIEKYGIREMDAIRKFIESETYDMLTDSELEIYKMSPCIIFDMWESEQVTGDPRTSQYIRGDDNE